MKICFMCDLHLPDFKESLQYKVLDWAVEDMRKKATDCIIFAGDVTCDGNIKVYKEFINRMKETQTPFIYIPGNSDLRNKACREEVAIISSPVKNEISGQIVYAINDCNGEISEVQFAEIEQADENSIVFRHHSDNVYSEVTRKRLALWRETHPDTMSFYGHRHISLVEGCDISLQAMDPDKAIGESPCITYYDTDTKEIRKAYYFSPVPTDLYGHFGVSCYKTEQDIEFAIKNNLKNIELRPNCLENDPQALLTLVEKWRKNGGEDLSLHLPDVVYKNKEVVLNPKIDEYINIANALKINRITQHVPKISVKEAENGNALYDICTALAEKLNMIESDIVVGVENMHMTAADTQDDNRRFGYTPEEVIRYMECLSKACRHKVGINLDIGHARNNAPFSQKYQISSWYALVGKYVVGYHLHQVTLTDGKFENHMPITEIYGKLISCASFFDAWALSQINKAPIIFEMRPEGAYEKTLATFEHYKNRRIFDIHCHTNYSSCGKDNPRDVIETAIRNGISVIGISDHNYGIGTRKAEYLKEMRLLAKEYGERITVLCGIEIATYPDKYDILDPNEISEYDYCLIEHITEPSSVAGGDLFQFCKNLGIPCGIAHTNLYKYCEKKGFAPKEFFRKLGENNIFWEMNVTYDSIHCYSEHEYVLDFMADQKKIDLVKKSGVYVSVGFDGHRREDYDGIKVHAMYDFLKANNIKTADELIFKRRGLIRA